MQKIQILHLDTHAFQYKLKQDMTPLQLMDLFCISKKKWNQYPFKNNQTTSIQYDTVLKKDSICTHTFTPMNYYAYSEESIEILYEDTICIVVNKPPFLLVHDDGNDTDTLQNRVNSYLFESGWPFSAQAIHRIDYETSGILLFSKFPFFQGLLDKQFERHDVIKEYYALVEGRLPFKDKTIDSPISRNRHVSNAMIVHPKGKRSISHIHVEKIKKNTLVKVKIDTGRKHQIRVHMASIHHPIINDPIYGHVIDDRGLLLQNFHLKFYQPVLNEWIDIQIDLDPRMK